MTKVTAKRGAEDTAGPAEQKKLHGGEATQGSQTRSSRFAFPIPLSLAGGGFCAISSSPRARRQSS